MFRVILLGNQRLENEDEKIKKLLNADDEVKIEVDLEYTDIGFIKKIQENDYDCVLFNNSWNESEISHLQNSQELNESELLFILLHYKSIENDCRHLFKSDYSYSLNEDNYNRLKEWIIEKIGQYQLMSNIKQDGLKESNPFGEETKGIRKDPALKEKNFKKSTLFAFISFIISFIALYYVFDKIRTKEESQIQQKWENRFKYVESDLFHKLNLLKTANNYFNLQTKIDHKNFTQFSTSLLRHQTGITSFDVYDLKGQHLFNYPWNNTKTSLQNDLTKNIKLKITVTDKNLNFAEGLMITMPFRDRNEIKGYFTLNISYAHLTRPLYHQLQEHDYYHLTTTLNKKEAFSLINSKPKKEVRKKMAFGELSLYSDKLQFFIKFERVSINWFSLFIYSLGVSILTFIITRKALKIKEKQRSQLNYHTRLRTHQISRYKRIFHVSQDALIVLGDQDKIVLSNDASQKMFGFTQEEMLQKSIGDLFPNLKRDAFSINFSKFFRNTDGKRYKVREINGIRSNNQSIPCSVSTSRFKYYLWDQYIVIIRDISETVLFRKDLMQKNEQLKLLDSSKNVFLSNVSHELRTPLTAIISSSNMINRMVHQKKKNEQFTVAERIQTIIQEKKISAEDIPTIEKMLSSIDNFVPIINKEAQRLLDMVNEVLDLAKIEAGKMELYYNFIDINTVIDRAYESFKGMCLEKNRKFKKSNVDDGSFAFIDQDRLLQVIQNLLNNAIKFSEKDNTIEIKVTREEHFFKISIIDDGIGISEEDQKSIFKRFQQVESVQKGKPKGTGLGLSISKHILKKHGSFLDVNSKIGEGSEFYFTLPIQKPKLTDAIPYVNKRIINHD